MKNIHISIHKALTSLDVAPGTLTVWVYDFNPQGSHEPRLLEASRPAPAPGISIHKALTSLDVWYLLNELLSIIISIHKALTSLDEIP